jgi:hypothetical protein
VIHISNNTINILLDGKILTNNVLAPGSIINANYKLIDPECTVMEISNIYFAENAKIIYNKEELCKGVDAAELCGLPTLLIMRQVLKSGILFFE